ncbi:MAG: hypothetical protein MI921_29230 [Cytophagales bacterium]|nr:hypothetical protein [Cytophagales bacterium]
MSQTKRWQGKCFTGKILTAENDVFENKLNNSPNTENLNDALCLEISWLWGGTSARAEKRVGKLY